VILHSWADDVVPFSHGQELVRNSELPVAALIEIGTDHRLPVERCWVELAAEALQPLPSRRPGALGIIMPHNGPSGQVRRRPILPAPDRV
jgi:hypothetical protein